MRTVVIAVASLAAGPALAALTPGNCTFYQNTTTNCESNCGKCFNPGARAGVMCVGQGIQVGYLCSPDDTFACMDWTFGSQSMLRAEQSFNKRAGDSVYFGVGTFGTSGPQQGLGACYRLKVDTVDRDIIAQSINTGSDVSGNQFDLQVGDGGAGAFNSCAGGSGSMFPGSYDAWGKRYGGVDNREQCAGLPKYPQSAGPMKAAGDDLVSLCQYSFDKKVRGEGGSNPTLLDATRVKCPEELVEMTQIQRNDEPSSHFALAEHRLAGFPNAEVKCQASMPGAGTAYCLTRMMDCRKPSGAWRNNVQSSLMVAGRKLVQTCTQDGYTRIDVQCGCKECYC